MLLDHERSRVIGTKETAKGRRRRRECIACSFRWSTLELDEAELERIFDRVIDKLQRELNSLKVI